MVNVRKKRYTVSEETKKRENLYHLKKAFRALNSAEWYDMDEVIENILSGKSI